MQRQLCAAAADDLRQAGAASGPGWFQIGEGQVIKAWDEGVMTMALGETAEITCTPDYAYGAGGFPAWGIMPNSHLRFEIEVISIDGA